MLRAMPVASISRPRNTNSGTDSRMMWLIPSSIRLTTTGSGGRVVIARNAKVAIANTKAIGAPASAPRRDQPNEEHEELVVAHRGEYRLEHPQAGADQRNETKREQYLPDAAG